MKKINLTLLMLVFFVINLYGEKGFNLIATIRGESKGDAFGIVCGLGDINQDGYDDFAVGAWETMNGGSYVKIYFGGNPSDTIADLRLTGEMNNEILNDNIYNMFKLLFHPSINFY